MKNRLEQLQRIMNERGFDAYVVFTSDDHGSEYIPDHFKGREYLTGFTGSAGTLVVTKDSSRLWTDGRYFLQAERELKASGATLMKDGVEGVPSVIEFLKSLGESIKVAFDFSQASTSFVEALKKELPSASLVDYDAVEELWGDRPTVPASKAFIVPFEQAGEGVKTKLDKLVAEVKKNECDFALVSSLDDIAWLFNLRGDDVLYNPVNYAYIGVSASTSVLPMNTQD